VAIEVFGYLGAAAATVFTAYIWAATFNVFMISRTYKVSSRGLLPIRKLAGIAGISALASLSFLMLLIPVASPPVRVVMVGIPFATVLVLLYFLTGMVSGKSLQTIRAKLFRG
jgi:hypothetical protein